MEFSLFSSYFFPWLYCVDFSVAALYSLFYVTRELHWGFYTEDEPKSIFLDESNVKLIILFVELNKR